MPIVSLLLGLIQYAPQAISEITAVYHAVKADMSETDRATIDAALTAAIASDAQATKNADDALDAAAQN